MLTISSENIVMKKLYEKWPKISLLIKNILTFVKGHLKVFDYVSLFYETLKVF